MKKKRILNYENIDVETIFRNICSLPNEVILQQMNKLAKDSVANVFKGKKLGEYDRLYFEKLALLEIMNLLIEDFKIKMDEKRKLELMMDLIVH